MMNKKEIKTRIAEIQQELDSLKAQLNAPEKKTGWEKPEVGQKSWYITIDNHVWLYIWRDSPIDNALYNIGNCFTSKELAENIARYQSLDLRIRRRIAEICEPITTTKAYTICYNGNKVEVGHMLRDYGGWRCDTYEHAEQIIEEFKDDLLWYFTEFKDRMDG